MNPEELRRISQIITEVGITLYPIVAIYFVRSFVDACIAGVIWKVGRKYNENDVVLLDEMPARIVKIGLFNVEFYTYRLNEQGQVLSGFSVMVANDKLREKIIKKPLMNLDLPKELKPIIN